MTQICCQILPSSFRLVLQLPRSTLAYQSLETIIKLGLLARQNQTLDDILPLKLDRQDRMVIVTDGKEKAIRLLTFENLISSAIGHIIIVT